MVAVVAGVVSAGPLVISPLGVVVVPPAPVPAPVPALLLLVLGRKDRSDGNLSRRRAATDSAGPLFPMGREGAAWRMLEVSS